MSNKKSDKIDKRAAALRENLRKRKAKNNDANKAKKPLKVEKDCKE